MSSKISYRVALCLKKNGEILWLTDKMSGSAGSREGSISLRSRGECSRVWGEKTCCNPHVSLSGRIKFTLALPLSLTS